MAQGLQWIGGTEDEGEGEDDPMRRASRVDANQSKIVAELRQLGASVQLLHAVGGGVPDLLIGFRGRNYLLEVKTVKGKLNPLQTEWHTKWKGQTRIVRTPEEAIQFLISDSRR